MSHETIVRDLRALGRTADSPAAPDHLATVVLARVAAPPVRRVPRGRTAIAVAAALAALLVTPPVRAAVADWFGFAGVLVREAPGSTGPEGEAPPPAPVDGAMTVAEAAAVVDFVPLVPAELGSPEAVDVSADRRVVSMTWSTPGGPVRLDQFDGRLDYAVLKTAPDVRYAAVGGVDGLWFAGPHEVAFLDEHGRSRTESARLAGTTLIWPVDGVTLRLEGDLTLAEAIDIGGSAAPYDG